MLKFLMDKKEKVKRIIRKTSSDSRNIIGTITHIGIPRPGPAFLDSDKINVMIMINSISRGGAERVAVELASGFADDFNVVLLYNKENEYQYKIDQRVRLIRMPVFFL